MRRRRRPTWLQDLFDGLAVLVVLHGLVTSRRRPSPAPPVRRPIEPMPRPARPDPTRIINERLN